MSVNVCIAFGGVALLGLVGFVVAWRLAPSKEQMQAEKADQLNALLALNAERAREMADAMERIRELKSEITESPSSTSGRKTQQGPEPLPGGAMPASR